MNPDNVKYHSSIFHGVLALLCITFLYIFGVIPNVLISFALILSFIFSLLFGWLFAHHYLPSKTGKYIYEPYQITLIVSYLSVLFVCLSVGGYIIYQGEGEHLGFFSSLIGALLVSFVVSAPVWLIAIPAGMLFGRYIRGNYS